jgi:hypothetical protein
MSDIRAEQMIPPEQAPTGQAATDSTGGHGVVLRGVHAYYGAQHAVKGVDIE